MEGIVTKPPKDRSAAQIALDLAAARAWAKKHGVKKLKPESAYGSTNIFVTAHQADLLTPLGRPKKGS